MTLTSRSGSIFLMALTTACATPPEAAKPRASALALLKASSGLSGRSAKLTALASNRPISSSKVRTKSTSLRTERRLASSFLAAQGPIKQIRALGFSFLMRRAVRTMGVMAMLMHSACWGNSFLAITLHAGQQDVPMNGILAGTSSMKSFASSMVHRSAPMATSATSAKPSRRMASFSLEGVMPGNWLMKAGATMATTSSPRLMDWISWKICPLSTIAPNGQLTRHMPQETHLS